MNFEKTEAFAAKMDAEDTLKEFRSKFFIPKTTDGQEVAYFTGNSLGLQPKNTRENIEHELKGWETLGVEGHFHSNRRPWFHYHEYSKNTLSKIVGAKELEVVSMNNLTSNLHFMMVSFYRPEGKRFKILMESGAFPSDQYAVESQVRFHGYDPESAILELKPRKDENLIRNEDIKNIIDEQGDEIALILLPGIQYYTGQLFDMESITKWGHEKGANVGFDLAHAAGNVPMHLHDWDVDFAVWCSYKYLNSGPGNVSGVFVHEKHSDSKEIPRFAGWWGYDEEERFLMKKGFKPMPGADGWQLSNVNVIASAAHLASLELFGEVGMEKLRAKSILLTAYFEFLLSEINKNEKLLSIITPKEEEGRGCQLSLFFHKDGKKIFDQLTENGVIVDWREPCVIRAAPVPLYNSFKDVYRFYKILKATVNG
ncbi:MAG: kynureninase [Bacteroidota bacterium]